MFSILLFSAFGFKLDEAPCEEPFFSNFLAAAGNATSSRLSVNNWSCVFASASHGHHLSAACTTSYYECTISVLIGDNDTYECVGDCRDEFRTHGLLIACICLGIFTCVLLILLIVLCCCSFAPCCHSKKEPVAAAAEANNLPREPIDVRIVSPVIQYQPPFNGYQLPNPSYLPPYPVLDIQPCPYVSANPTVDLAELGDPSQSKLPL
jgi:hypothetical protein